MTESKNPVADWPNRITLKTPDGRSFDHIWDEEVKNAVGVALAIGRPLLIRGEPGVGKSQVARAAAAQLACEFVERVVDAQTEARDLLYEFDAVGRLTDGFPRPGAAVPQDARSSSSHPNAPYVAPGPLWKALDWKGAWTQRRLFTSKSSSSEETTKDKAGPRGNRVVLLIDEIDKAEPEVPNTLLSVFGERRFEIPVPPDVVKLAEGQDPPLVIITSNDERELPYAFVRRCLPVVMALPEERETFQQRLAERALARFDEEERKKNPNLETNLKALAGKLFEARQNRGRGERKPGQAEFFDLVDYLVRCKGERRVDAKGLWTLEHQVTQLFFGKYPSPGEGGVA